MLQEVFRIPYLNLPIYGYGMMLVIAFLACVQLVKRMALLKGLDPEIFVNAGLLALVAGVVGARLSHVLENLPTYTNPNRSVVDNLKDAINIRSGGLTFYGGFLLATPCCIFYALKKRVPLLAGMDIIAPALMLGLGIGRIGCYLNGCCYGMICQPTVASSIATFPYYSNPYIDQYSRGLIQPPVELLARTNTGLKNWDMVHAEGLDDLAKAQQSLPVQPTQLYSTLTAFLLCGLLVAYWTLPHLDGQVFALMLLLEGPARFLLEMIRVEPAVFEQRFGGFLVSLSLSMVLGIVVFIAGIVMSIWIGNAKRKPWRSPYAPALA